MMLVTTNKVLFLAILAGVVLAANYVAAVDYMVGDNKGWTLNFDYQAWAKNKVFLVGDRLVFYYPEGNHNVVKVNGTGFKKCVQPPNSVPLTSGNDIIELTSPGKKWYICSVGIHCSDYGQKLAINVMKPREMDASPPFPALVPSPGPSALPPWVKWFPMPGILMPPPSPSYDPGSPGLLPTLPIGKFPFLPTIPVPAPAPGFEFPWRKIFHHHHHHHHSPASSPAPAYEFPWKEIFFHLHPPSPSPSYHGDAAEADASQAIPSRELSTFSNAAGALTPGYEFPWREIFSHLHSPAPAPTPGFEFPWKEMFSHLSPSLSPEASVAAPASYPEFPIDWWKKFFSHLPMENSPSPSPAYAMNEYSSSNADWLIGNVARTLMISFAVVFAMAGLV